jgi:carbonic anhydrase
MTIPSTLLAGYRRFRDERFVEWGDKYRALAAGQQPGTMVISCADSRVDPSTIFSAGPGELFVVRNVAAVVPPREVASGGYHGTSAALEFAVTVLKVSDVVVMGHGRCGGVAAAFAVAEKQPVGQFIGPWVSLISDVCAKVPNAEAPAVSDAAQKEGELRVVKKSLENLMTFPFVSEAVAGKTLALHGAWFSIGEGQLQWLDEETGAFAEVPEA